MVKKLILIGASTGGPGHIKKILKSLPKSFTTPIVIAQHMNKIFIPTFVSQFNNDFNFEVLEVSNGLEIKEKYVYICEQNTTIQNIGNRLSFNVSNEKTLYNPSIDRLFESVIYLTNRLKILAILLTGIGDDGAFGLSELEKKGAICIAENQRSAIVYGMPKKAIEINPHIISLDLDEVIEEIKKFDSGV